jgi:hypothetical protein
LQNEPAPGMLDLHNVRLQAAQQYSELIYHAIVCRSSPGNMKIAEHHVVQRAAGNSNVVNDDVQCAPILGWEEVCVINAERIDLPTYVTKRVCDARSPKLPPVTRNGEREGGQH